MSTNGGCLNNRKEMHSFLILFDTDLILYSAVIELMKQKYCLQIDDEFIG